MQDEGKAAFASVMGLEDAPDKAERVPYVAKIVDTIQGELMALESALREMQKILENVVPSTIEDPSNDAEKVGQISGSPHSPLANRLSDIGVRVTKATIKVKKLNRMIEV